MRDVRIHTFFRQGYKQSIDMYRSANQEKCRQEVTNYFLHGYS